MRRFLFLHSSSCFIFWGVLRGFSAPFRARAPLLGPTVLGFPSPSWYPPGDSMCTEPQNRRHRGLPWERSAELPLEKWILRVPLLVVERWPFPLEKFFFLHKPILVGGSWYRAQIGCPMTWRKVCHGAAQGKPTGSTASLQFLRDKSRSLCGKPRCLRF